MDIPREVVALRLKTGGLTIAIVLPWILGGALPLPRALRTACMVSALTASIAGIATSRKLIREEGYYQARLEMFNEGFQSELAYQTAALEQALEAEYFPVEPQIEPSNPSNLEPVEPVDIHEGSTNRTRIEPGSNLDRTSDRTSIEPPPIADALATEIEPSIRALVITMRRQRMTQDEIILKTWGVKKGNSSKYNAALEKYRKILSEAGLN